MRTASEMERGGGVFKETLRRLKSRDEEDHPFFYTHTLSLSVLFPLTSKILKELWVFLSHCYCQFHGDCVSKSASPERGDSMHVESVDLPYALRVQHSAPLCLYIHKNSCGKACHHGWSCRKPTFKWVVERETQTPQGTPHWNVKSGYREVETTASTTTQSF